MGKTVECNSATSLPAGRYGRLKICTPRPGHADPCTVARSPWFSETKMVPEGIRNHPRFVAISPATSENNAFNQPLERRPSGDQVLSSHEAGTDRNRCCHNQRRYSC